MMGNHRSLYDDALQRFTKEITAKYSDSPKDLELLKQFLQERASPEETKVAAETLQKDAGKKYGGKKVGDIEIPDSWIETIMSNIENFVAAGDNLTEGAPESVGLAWYAVKLTLNAIHSNYELYTFFGSGLSDISEIMIMVRHYDRLYDERAKRPNWKPSPLVDKLFQDTTDAYAAVLDFSFVMKRHLTAGSLARIKHGFKDFFGVSKVKFDDKLENVATLKKKILDGSQGAFQDKTLTQLDGMSTTITDIRITVDQIQAAQGIHQKNHEEAVSYFNRLLKDIEDFKASSKRKTRWDYALEEYQSFRATLRPLKGCFKELEKAIDTIHPGTCQWVFEEEAYQDWENSGDDTMLLITGDEGTGKSFVIASIANSINMEPDSDRILLYVTCALTKDSGQEKLPTADNILQTFMYYLYSRAVNKIDKDASLLEDCNAVFQDAKARFDKLPPQQRMGRSSDPEFVEGILGLVSALKRDVVVVLDGINKNLEDSTQETLFETLWQLHESAASELEDNRIQILVGSSSSAHFSKSVERSDNISILDVSEGNQDDLGLVLADFLQSVPGLSSKEQEEAKSAILDKAHSKFSYIFETAIPFMNEPFQRPISKRLAALPGGLADVYSKALRQLSPNYVGLLKTALTWILLSPENRVLTREVMDAFQGTYDIAAEVEEDSAEVDNNDGFPDTTPLEIAQLERAAQSILKLSHDGSLVFPQDLDGLQEFFLDSKTVPEDNSTPSEGEVLCVKCEATNVLHKSLSIDSKDGHLQVTLACIRHLNNPLFQQRAGFLSLQMDTEEIEGSEPVKNEEEEPVQDIGERFDAAVQAEESQDEEDIVEHIFYDTEMSHPDDEHSQQASDTEDDASGDVRYEVRYWSYHLRQAGDFWAEEDREQSDTWKQLMVELDKFASNQQVFHAWQASYPEQPQDDAFSLTTGPYDVLHVAAYLGLTSWARRLLAVGADVNGVSGGFTPIHAAASRGSRLEMMQLLLSQGADVNTKSSHGLNALHYWIRENPGLEGVRLLLQHGADPRIVSDPHNETALHYFSKKGEDPGVLKLLLEAGADINAVETQAFFPPLHFLLYFRREAPSALLKAFIEHGADVNMENAISSRALHIAAALGQGRNLEILLESTVEEIDDPDLHGTTALQDAIYQGSTECARILLENGADPEISDKLQRTSLHTAVRRGFIDIAKLLVAHGCKLNPLDIHGWSPFFCALLGVRDSSAETAALLLDALLKSDVSLAEINKPSRSGRTALRQAATRGFDDVVLKLTRAAEERNDAAGLAIDAQDAKKGMTALHRAASGGHLESVRLLLQAKADTTIKDSRGRTALVLAYDQWAVAGGKSSYEETVSLLIEAHPPAAVNDAELIAVCATNGSTKLLKQLWLLGADLSRPDKFGWTPLELSRNSSSTGAVSFLQQQATWVKLLPARWSSQFPATTIVGAQSILDDGVAILHKSTRQVCITTDRPIPPRLERYYFEITVRDLPGTVKGNKDAFFNLAIGFASIGGAGIAYPGSEPRESAPSAKSWGYDTRIGGLYSSNEDDLDFDEPQRIEVGDTVGCGVDLGSGEVWATRNGVKLGSLDGVQGRLFPLIGLREPIYFETNFGTSDSTKFLWDPEHDVDMSEGEEDDNDDKDSEGEGTSDEEKQSEDEDVRE
ncbi:hypothetical protein QBC35DRAFT_488009 [Podospora australis]|uniref:B30.2/SPRY domain-containing protein n=1 Tax=Podospora australis TaxID=1536484 RepID=A0AAN7ALZ9_9PEZI|nr:hypothetical protein QBC35DRAFT_488009 [Podospora australis]